MKKVFSGCGRVVLLKGLWFTRHRGQKHREDRPHPSLVFSSGADHRATQQNTQTSETQNSQLVPMISVLSLQPLMLHPSPPPLPPPPLLSLQRSLSHSPPPHLQHPNSALQRQMNSAIWSKSRKDHRGMFPHDVMVFSNQPCSQPISACGAIATQVYTN